MTEEVTVFLYGDSNNLSTWSNVPFFLTKTMENKNITVNRVNVEPNKYFVFIWNKLVLKLLKIFFNSETTYTFDRTPFFRKFVDMKMKKAVNKYKNTDMFLSISFSFHPKKYTNKPVIMFCDWTYDYYFDHFLKRKPDKLEMQEIKNQRLLQESTDAMIVLFPDVCEYLKIKSTCNNIYYLGNVVNSDNYRLTNEVIENKYRNNNIVFIGSKKYLPGLNTLLRSFTKLREKYDNLTLDVIGINKNDTDVKYENVNFWGYLNKSELDDKAKYYDIVNNAKVFVNTTPNWASFSAALDVMYHGCPIITSKYRSFQETFGNEIKFGSYSINDEKTLTKKIHDIFDIRLDEYREKCKLSRNAVEPYSWSNYVDKIIDISNQVKEK